MSPQQAYWVEEGNQHERVIEEKSTVHVGTIQVSSWNEGVQETRDLVLKKNASISGAYMEATVEFGELERLVVVRGRVDQLRLRRSGFLGKKDYVPIEIKSHHHPELGDWVQLQCYLWLLGQMQGDAPSSGELWLGMNSKGLPIQRIQYAYDEAHIKRVLLRAASVLVSEDNEPSINILPHCDICHWKTYCLSQAQSESNITLLSGIRRDTTEDFRRKGITSLKQVAVMSIDELRNIHFVGPKRSKDFRAQAQAYLTRKPVFTDLVLDKDLAAGWWFDIETNPLLGIPWSIGWRDVERITVAIVAPFQSGKVISLPSLTIQIAKHHEEAWRLMAQAMESSDAPVYHWTYFDASVMRSTASPEDYEALSGRLVDLHEIVKNSVQFPVKGTTLKTIAAYLGFNWTLHESWEIALQDYGHWRRTKRQDFLERAVAYQADDINALMHVWRWLYANGKSNDDDDSYGNSLGSVMENS